MNIIESIVFTLIISWQIVFTIDAVLTMCVRSVEIDKRHNQYQEMQTNAVSD